MFSDGWVLLKDLAAVWAGEGGVLPVCVHMLLHIKIGAEVQIRKKTTAKKVFNRKFNR
jgi:hypothetical protein